MNRGPKLKSLATKKLAETFKACVDNKTAPIVQLSQDSPVHPASLSEPAKDVWAIDLPRVVACGAREPDSNFVAVYC